ncbi:hypothetical protein EPN83_01100 [Patescibacteria group bacterium]|nr:MAG: hypothetical protein EPN83_01100 [Patescibacteria group bacterium]
MSLEFPGMLDQELDELRLQFSFSNDQAVPRCWIRRLSDESKKEVETRKSREWKSVKFIRETEPVTGRQLLADLELEGWWLADVQFQRRLDKDRRRYNMLRFVFFPPWFGRKLDQQKVKRLRDARVELVRLLADAFWRVRAYRNTMEQTWISMNFEHRIPVIDSLGGSILQWRKDGKGRRIGDNPVPLKADWALRVRGGMVRLVWPFLPRIPQRAA